MVWTQAGFWYYQNLACRKYGTIWCDLINFNSTKEFLFIPLIPECKHQLLQAVEGKLNSDPAVRERQLQLLSAIISDVSEPSKELLAKLNCGPKRECSSPQGPLLRKLCSSGAFELPHHFAALISSCIPIADYWIKLSARSPCVVSGEEMYQMAAAMFQVREQGTSHDHYQARNEAEAVKGLHCMKARLVARWTCMIWVKPCHPYVSYLLHFVMLGPSPTTALVLWML